MLHQDMTQEAQCPECGFDGIELTHWVDRDGASNYRATCDCGFEHKKSYSAREIAASMAKGPDESYPMEYPPVEEGGLESNAELKFSPRLFLERAVQ